jgi:hypothetical protein
VPRATANKVNDIDGCGLTLSELQELWLGPNSSQGSLFHDRQELESAWAQGRAVVMRLWGSHGRRPAGFYEFEYAGRRPPYDLERSTLWREGLLTAEERAELEREWEVEFAAAQTPNFMLNTGHEILKDDEARAAHYRWADIPHELVKRWTAAHRRRAGKRTETALPGGAAPLNVEVPK